LRLQPGVTMRAQDAFFEKELVESISCLDGLAMKLCQNRSRAEDLRQETLVRAWNARERFRPGTCFKAWICTIMRNQFRSELRSCWIRRQAPWDPLVAEHTMSIDDEQFSIVSFHDVLRMMETLPASQQHALTMIGAEGLTYAEAAKLEACPRGTIKSRVARARRVLTDAMENGTTSKGPHYMPADPVPALGSHDRAQESQAAAFW
jgi:RNA polymerase sigma-70 factor, ECF subfamily